MEDISYNITLLSVTCVVFCSTIPALYSNADGSQDLSLMAKFGSSESQMSMSLVYILITVDTDLFGGMMIDGANVG